MTSSKSENNVVGVTTNESSSFNGDDDDDVTSDSHCRQRTLSTLSSSSVRHCVSVGLSQVRSANYGELVEPRTRRKRYGPRSFRVAAPFVRNNLPRHLRNDDISREQFARDLKTFLFARAYSSEAPLRTSV